MDDQVKMTYTGVIKVQGEKTVRVRFERADEPTASYAECQIPSCSIDSSYGFSQEELDQLEKYLHENQDGIYEKASHIKTDLFTILG